MNRLFWTIAFTLAVCSLTACSSSSSSSSDEELEDDLSTTSDKRQDEETKLDSLGRPLSSAVTGDSLSLSSSSAVIASVIGDSLITDTTVVSDVDHLPECTSANEGESFMVESEKTLYFCVGGNWEDLESVIEASPVSCRNGVLSLGEADEDESSSAPVTQNPWGGFGGNTQSSLDTAEPRLVGAHIAGVAQKGPFRYGTSVKLIELDSVQRLADSKLTHKTCILDADGNYSFDGVDLRSPYLRVEAKGFFRNELTGGISAAPVTLNAVVDMTERDTVNVNMLTHMEAPRVLKLVENSGNNQPIRTVKAQALQEILASFEIRLGTSGGNSLGGGNGGFNGWNFGQQQQALSTDGRFAEDIGLFDGDEYSGALLAVSIMMQRKGSGEEMLQYAAGIAERIKGNGNWDDNNAKADLADWLMELDTSGAYAAIRNNIASWHLGDVPEFEKHLKHFWTTVYNLGECGTHNADSVRFISNSLSAYFVSGYDQPGPKIRFICDAQTHEWRAATDIEKDTVGFGAGTYEGQIRNGKINTDRYYVYDSSKKTWRIATSDDIQEFEEIADVYKGLKSGEKVIFVLRHAERTSDTGKNGHLTEGGQKQSQSVGEKFKGESIYFANSTYTRSKETCEYFAKGAGADYSENTIEELDGEWFVKDESKYSNYKNGNGGGWVVNSEYAYKGSYSDAFYPLESRSQEFITEVVKPQFSKVNRVGVWISHDTFVVPLTVALTEKKVNLRYFDTKQWINYLAGIAIIMDSKGDLRYVPVKGLSSGNMTM